MSAMEGGVIIGRERELERAERFLDRLAEGPAALTLEGEPGIGKTTVWQAALDRAVRRGVTVLSSRAAEAETRLSYAALLDLLEPVGPEVLDALSKPQRKALDAALLRGEVDASPDQRAVSVASLVLLRSLAEAGPTVVAVDDVQWLDLPSARVLRFALRRLEDETVGVLATTRTTADGDPMELERTLAPERADRIRVGSIPERLIERILLSAVGEEVPRATLRRVSKESGGNPLLALEIARSLTRDGIEIGPGEALPVPSNFAELLPARIADLSPDAERILLFAAATAHPSIELLRAADGDAERADSALRQAETAGVVVLESNRVRFAHPLLASAAYASAVPNVRRETHRRLAEVAEDPEERARHLALATAEPDPQVAAALDEAARRAQSRGAPDAAADLVELARALTPADDTETIAYRTMDAADYHFQAGDVAHARLLTKEALVAAEPGPLRARILHHWSELEWNDVKRCRELSEQALAEADDDDEFQSRLREGHAWVGLIGGDLALAEDEATESLRLAEHTRLPARQASALTALAWAKTLRGTWPTDLWDRAFAMQDSLEGLQAYVMPGLFHAQSLMWADDLDAARRELDVEDGRCIERGQETMRWDVLQSLTYVECRAGNLEMAERHADEAFETVVDAGLDQAMECVLAPRALVRAFRGNVAGARADGIQALEISQRHGDVLWEIYARGALGVLELSLGRFEDAHAHLEPAPELLESMGVREPGFAPYLADEIEALVALGRLDRAEQVTDRLEEQGRVLDRGLALATAARCRGLLAGARGLEAEAMASFEEAMAQHARITYPIELGRTFLALGEVQRRFKIRRQARESLRAAEEILEKVGARLWAQRARAEAARIGGRAVAPDELTETERRIAELVVQGHTNREVAHALFVSVKTVEANLSRAYHKLGITSRRELGSRLHAEGADPHT